MTSKPVIPSWGYNEHGDWIMLNREDFEAYRLSQERSRRARKTAWRYGFSYTQVKTRKPPPPR